MVKVESILHNMVAYVDPKDFIRDDGFISSSLDITNKEMCVRAFTPFAVCVVPKCVQKDGFALLFKMEDGETGWVFIPPEIFINWLDEMDMLPSDDSWWSWQFIRKYFWGV